MQEATAYQNSRIMYTTNIKKLPLSFAPKSSVGVFSTRKQPETITDWNFLVTEIRKPSTSTVRNGNSSCCLSCNGKSLATTSSVTINVKDQSNSEGIGVKSSCLSNHSLSIQCPESNKPLLLIQNHRGCPEKCIEVVLSMAFTDAKCKSLEALDRRECIDLDTSVNGPGLKHVLKASLDDDRNNYCALGIYYLEKNIWTPDNPVLDVGIGLKYDYGKFYSSKKFFDQNKQKRILWSLITETESEVADTQKGWASLQVIPRLVYFSKKTGTYLIQWPVEEIEDLRLNETEFKKVKLEAGSVMPLDIGNAAPFDVNAEFSIGKEVFGGLLDADVGYSSTTSCSATDRIALGPDDVRSELAA